MHALAKMFTGHNECSKSANRESEPNLYLNNRIQVRKYIKVSKIRKWGINKGRIPTSYIILSFTENKKDKYQDM